MLGIKLSPISKKGYWEAKRVFCNTHRLVVSEYQRQIWYDDISQYRLWHSPTLYTGLILCLGPANERRCYFVTTSLIDWVQAWNQPWYSMKHSKDRGLYSLSSSATYRQISRRFKAARLDVIMIVSLRNLTGISAALPRRLREILR